MKNHKFVVLRFCARAPSAPQTDSSSSDMSITIALIPAVLGDEIENFVSIVIYAVDAALWQELWFNTEHERALLKVSVEIRSDHFYRGYILPSPPKTNDLDERFFKVTASFAETLRRDVYSCVVNHHKFKALSFSENETDIGGGCDELTRRD